MIVKITGEAYAETGGVEVVIAISESCRDYFSDRSYGHDLEQIGVFLICVPEKYRAPQRIIRSKKKRSLFVDVLLDYEEMCNATAEDRFRLTAKSFYSEVAKVLKIKKFKDFKTEAFLEDWRHWIDQWCPN